MKFNVNLMGLVLLGMVGIVHAENAFADTCSNTAMTAVVNQYVQPLIATNQIPGAEVGVYENGQVCYFSYGYANIVNNQPVAPAPNTIFEIGSITKLFTADILAIAAERNLLNLDAPIVNSSLPSWVSINPQAKAVTFRELANFSSGMPRLTTNLNPVYNDDPLAQLSFPIYSVADFAQFIAGWYPAQGLPATNLYSNASYALLGYLLTYIFNHNQDYAGLVANLIVDPLHMVDTTTTINPATENRLAQGYVTGSSPFTPGPYYPQSIYNSGAIIKSTAQDMITFIAASLGATEFNNINIPSEITNAMQTASTLNYYYGDNNQYGQALAWYIIPATSTNDEIIAKNGATASFSSFIALDPSKNLGVIFLTNIGSDLDSFNASNLITDVGTEMIENIPAQ